MPERKSNNRNHCYTLLAIGKKQLGMDEDAYRDFLSDHGATMKGDKISASTMHIGDLEKAVSAMKTLGFKPARKSKPKNNNDWRLRMTNKITAIWCALYDAGVVHNKSSIAMERWCASVTKVAKMEWYESKDYNRCIEGLKSWAKREAVKLRD